MLKMYQITFRFDLYIIRLQYITKYSKFHLDANSCNCVPNDRCVPCFDTVFSSFLRISFRPKCYWPYARANFLHYRTNMYQFSQTLTFSHVINFGLSMYTIDMDCDDDHTAYMTCTVLLDNRRPIIDFPNCYVFDAFMDFVGLEEDEPIVCSFRYFDHTNRIQTMTPGVYNVFAKVDSATFREHVS